MSAHSIRDRSELPLDVLDRIDRICDQFEAAWAGGETPRIEDYLGAIAVEHRTELLGALLAAEIDARRNRGERPEPAEYNGRFPTEFAAIASAFTATRARGRAVAQRALSRPDTGRDLLFGLIALQNGLVEQDELVAAFRAWTRDKARPLAAHLAERAGLDGDDLLAVEALVARHLKKHGGDSGKSLAAVAGPRGVLESLAQLGDADLGGTLSQVGSGARPGDRDPDCTTTFSVGTATSDGERFQVLRPHARGGLGAVYVALDSELHREVALKQILDQHADDPGSRTRFLLEAEITGGLEHPGIVPVYGLGTYPDGRPYYAMRFIRGDSLKEAIDRLHSPQENRLGDRPGLSEAHENRPVSVAVGRRDAAHESKAPGPSAFETRKLLRRFTDVCNAIEYAHSRGVLHRDLKPGNVIVGKHGETLVVDWGLAKPLGRTESGTADDERPLTPHWSSGSVETVAGSAMGTPAYMSPEQAEGRLERLGPRSDVYSLGATLYCLLTGVPPFEGEVADVIRAVQRGAFRPPRAIDPAIDRALEAVCLKSMALQPEDRYGSARALVDDVEHWLADEPVTAFPETFSRRAWRWGRRNRTAVSAAGVAVMAVMIGLAAFSTFEARANSALQKAREATERALVETRESKEETERALGETKTAKRAADEALAQSEESRKQAEAVSNFLVETFRSPDPKQDGKEIKVAALLDRASTRLDEKFAGSKATHAAMLHALGRTYTDLGIYDKAIALLTKARGEREATLGLEHLDTLATNNYLARAYQQADRTADAIVLYKATLKLLEAKGQPDDERTLAIRTNLATSYWYAGRVADSVTLQEETLKLLEAKVGSNHERTLNSRHNLAIAYAAAGRLPEATALLERVFEQRSATLAPDHPDLLKTRINVALAYRSAGRLSEAIAIHEGTLKLMEPKLGPTHSDTLAVRINLGVAYQLSDRLFDAISLHEQTIKLTEATLAPNHRLTLMARNNLGGALTSAGRVSEAISLYKVTLKKFEANLGPDHPLTCECREGLAAAYEALHRWSDAETLTRDTLARRRKTESAALAQTLLELGWNLLNQRRWSEAELLLRECVAIRDKHAPGDWDRYDAMSVLGASLLGQGRFAEAEQPIVEGFQGMKARESKIGAQDRQRLIGAAERVVHLYENWGKPDTATSWKVKLGMPDLPVNVFTWP
jgi:serine/threonine protein kinase